ncbi:Putative NDP-sugar-epimerase [Propionibacterium freudenreichii]|uniref:NAD-dependent epimerase/dehydratase family protein n=1 Tax=Propionibacterium freudenreichii TaxID=1744 RepID=UPI0005A5C73E|nr:NAD-dependent epimerase/dehydratase family protein [Propionibacterium freudenreichii]CEI26536.1 Putative NDP-sugar-epimerase [Propionibacterium freudenreichii]
MRSAWVIGAGGLFGWSLADHLVGHGVRLFTQPIRWQTSAVDDLAAGLAAYASSEPDPVIFWCAGAGVPSSAPSVFAAELETFSAFLHMVRMLPQGQRERLRFFFTSSAGGVYAGSGSAPYDEAAPTRPLGAYGRAKLAMEDDLEAFAAQSGARVVCGRISNLYGPGQNLAKSQGLISVLLMGFLTHRPVQIYVPLDTIRDYLFVDDAAAIAAASVERVASEEPGSCHTKVLCNGYGTTIGALLGTIRLVIGHRPLIVQGASPLASVQTRDLSMRSRRWPELNANAKTSLLDGINRTYMALAGRHFDATHTAALRQ